MVRGRATFRERPPGGHLGVDRTGRVAVAPGRTSISGNNRLRDQGSEPCTGAASPRRRAAISRRRHRRVWPVAWIVACSLGSAPAKPDAGEAQDAISTDVVILVGQHAIYRQAADALALSLDRASLRVVTLELAPKIDDSAKTRLTDRLAKLSPRVIATSGVRATELALTAHPTSAVVFFMVPNTLDARFAGPDRRERGRLVGVSADVAPQRQLEWVATLTSGRRKVAIPYSDRTRHSAEALREAGKALGLDVVLLSASKKAFPAAIERLDASGADAVLMIPDPAVYDATTIKRLLLWGLRHEKPVVGFSSKVAQAGSLAAIHSDPAEVGRLTGRVVQQILSGTSPEQIGLVYTTRVTRAVNARTASLISVRLEDLNLPKDSIRYGE